MLPQNNASQINYAIDNWITGHFAADYIEGGEDEEERMIKIENK